MTDRSPRDKRWRFPVVPFQIRRRFPRPSAELVARFAGAYVPDICDLVGRMYTMQGIRSLHEPAVAASGVACTVKCPPGDNLAAWRALSLIEPGDMLVIDAQGFTEWSLGGFHFLNFAVRERGAAGVVVNGAFRDVAEAKEAGFALYAKDVAPWSGPKIGPGEINVPVCCGGVIVQPGDLVAASTEGIAVVPQDSLAVVADGLAAQAAAQSGSAAASGLAKSAGMKGYVAGLETYVDEIFAAGDGVYRDA